MIPKRLPPDSLRPLQAAGFATASGDILDGLVAVSDCEEVAEPFERTVLEAAAAFEVVDYVYFRRFDNADSGFRRSPQVAAYVVDDTAGRRTNARLAEAHRDIWLQGITPLIYVARPTCVDLLSCARGPDFWTAGANTPTYAVAETISFGEEVHDRLPRRVGPKVDNVQRSLFHDLEIATEIAARLSARRLADGTFWEDERNRQYAREEKAAHRALIQAVEDADRRLEGAVKPVRRRLLMLVILVKYLEDRGVMPEGYFGRFRKGVTSFLELLESADATAVAECISNLMTKFNGDVFSLGDHARDLTAKELRAFSKLVGAKRLGDRQHFWELFSFEHIPVEVISRLYQRFVTAPGAVYTPPLLATLLLDQVMPYDSLRGDETVLDPSCGSGVFLVGAFKRLVTAWRRQSGWKSPPVHVLQAILTRSLHGVELEGPALDLTAFSLAVAVCDALSPPVIWKELRFAPLRGRNLREGDFFDPETTSTRDGQKWPSRFDVVVGNPPFVSRLTAAGRLLNTMSVKQRGIVGAPTLPEEPPAKPAPIKLPDQNAAYLFLEEGLKLLKDGGKLCLIQPHGLLYNGDTLQFRRYLQKLCPLRSVLDFVSVRGLYEGKDPKTVAWLAERADDAGPIQHLTFRRTRATAERLAFEIDHYDWHEVSREDAETQAWVWRVNLLGGSRLRQIAGRLSRLRSLREFIESRGGGWDYGEGFVVGGRGKRKAKAARFLTGMPLLPTKSFKDSELFSTFSPSTAPVVGETTFEHEREITRYSAPLILIKEHDSLPVAYLRSGRLAYQHRIVGIHAPPTARAEVEAIYKCLSTRNRFYRFACAISGTQALTGKATAILKRDIDRLPYPEDQKELDLTEWEEAFLCDTLDYLADYVRLGQDSALLTEVASDEVLENYQSMFVKILGTVYKTLVAGQVGKAGGVIAQEFHFSGDRPAGLLTTDGLELLLSGECGSALRTTRIVRHYDGNTLTIIKPDRLRYWIPSTAIRDADDVFADLLDQGWY